jgi:thiamine biosynthesis lipoprotein
MEFSGKFRIAFFAGAYLSTYSGLVLLYFHERTADFFPTLKQVTLKVHIFSVASWLFLCGMLFAIHVIPQLVLKEKDGRRSGIWLIYLLFSMVATGYAIQLLPGVREIDVARHLHIILSLAFTGFFLFHVYVVKPSCRRILTGVVVVTVLLISPMFLLRRDAAESFPDEIKLSPAAADSAKKKIIHRNLPAMGTVLAAEIDCPRADGCEAGFQLIRNALDSVDAAMSIYHDSEITRINAHAGMPGFETPVSPDTELVLRQAVAISAQSHGNFDVTIKPLLELHGLYHKDPKKTAFLPSETELNRALALVDYRGLAIDRHRAGLRRTGMQIDLGGIAKGFTLDKAARLLKGAGFDSFTMNFGGQVLAQGRITPISVKNPLQAGAELLRCEISAGSVSVSAQSERFRITQGRKIGHLINPHTGNSEDRNLLTVVYHAQAMAADAWATALFFTDAGEFEKMTQRQSLVAYKLDARGKLLISAAARNSRLCLTPS